MEDVPSQENVQPQKQKLSSVFTQDPTDDQHCSPSILEEEKDLFSQEPRGEKEKSSVPSPEKKQEENQQEAEREAEQEAKDQDDPDPLQVKKKKYFTKLQHGPAFVLILFSMSKSPMQLMSKVPCRALDYRHLP